MFYGPRNCMGRSREIIKNLSPGAARERGHQYLDIGATKVTRCRSHGGERDREGSSR